MTDSTPARQDRKSAADEHEQLAPNSLVGSYFLADDERQWQGCVVAEPAPGVYLIELFSWLGGDSTHQELLRIEEMLGFTFYDTADWMRNAYEHGGVARRWEKAAASEEPVG